MPIETDCNSSQYLQGKKGNTRNKIYETNLLSIKLYIPKAPVLGILPNTAAWLSLYNTSEIKWHNLGVVQTSVGLQPAPLPPFHLLLQFLRQLLFQALYIKQIALFTHKLHEVQQAGMALNHHVCNLSSHLVFSIK